MILLLCRLTPLIRINICTLNVWHSRALSPPLLRLFSHSAFIFIFNKKIHMHLFSLFNFVCFAFIRSTIFVCLWLPLWPLQYYYLLLRMYMAMYGYALCIHNVMSSFTVLFVCLALSVGCWYIHAFWVWVCVLMWYLYAFFRCFCFEFRFFYCSVAQTLTQKISTRFFLSPFSSFFHSSLLLFVSVCFCFIFHAYACIVSMQ